jgi:hypothetical protein
LFRSTPLGLLEFLKFFQSFFQSLFRRRPSFKTAP